jgi:hypothetical protein
MQNKIDKFTKSFSFVSEDEKKYTEFLVKEKSLTELEIAMDCIRISKASNSFKIEDVEKQFSIDSEDYELSGYELERAINKAINIKKGA